LKVKRENRGRVQWLTWVIPATWEVEIGRIIVQGQPRQKVNEIPKPILSVVKEILMLDFNLEKF
jgi:hypothetical protein